MNLGIKLLGSGILNFDPCTACGMGDPDWGAYDMVVLCREPSGPPEIKSGGNDRTAMSKQATNLPSQHHRHGQSGSEYRQAGARGNLNKSYDSVKKQCLRSRTRSLDRVNTSNVKNASAKNLRSNVKQNDAKVGRLRSQSEEREETQKLSANKSRPQMKLTIPHTPQLLK